MSRWAGEGKDWIQLMVQGPHRKEDVTFSLLASMRQATEKRTEKGGGVPTKRPKDLAPLVLEVLTEDKKLMLEIRGDSKPVVDWVNCHTSWVSRISCANGGAVGWIYDNGWPIGLFTFCANTTRKPMPGPGKVSRAA